VLLVLSLAILAIALGMPTYRERQGEIYVAPGLVPGIYAIVLALLSATLGVRALLRARLGLGRTAPPEPGGTAIPLALVAVLGLIYCFGLIGRMPFWLATALFVAAFVAVFELPATPRPRWPRSVAVAAAIGIGTGVAVTLVFQKLFLVRLP
jgi:putative tricarboxylic transport membrane protein